MVIKYQVGQKWKNCPAFIDTDSKILHLEHSLKQVKKKKKIQIRVKLLSK